MREHEPTGGLLLCLRLAEKPHRIAGAHHKRKHCYKVPSRGQCKALLDYWRYSRIPASFADREQDRNLLIHGEQQGVQTCSPARSQKSRPARNACAAGSRTHTPAPISSTSDKAEALDGIAVTSAASPIQRAWQSIARGGRRREDQQASATHRETARLDADRHEKQVSVISGQHCGPWRP